MSYSSSVTIAPAPSAPVRARKITRPSELTLYVCLSGSDPLTLCSRLIGLTLGLLPVAFASCVWIVTSVPSCFSELDSTPAVMSLFPAGLNAPLACTVNLLPVRS